MRGIRLSLGVVRRFVRRNAEVLIELRAVRNLLGVQRYSFELGVVRRFC